MMTHGFLWAMQHIGPALSRHAGWQPGPSQHAMKVVVMMVVVLVVVMMMMMMMMVIV